MKRRCRRWSARFGLGKRISSVSLSDDDAAEWSRQREREREGEGQLDRSRRTPGIQISCACHKGGQVANRAAGEGDRDRHPETFITFGFKGAHCAANGVPRVPFSLSLSLSRAPRIRSILRRLPFRGLAKTRGRRKRRMQNGGWLAGDVYPFLPSFT